GWLWIALAILWSAYLMWNLDIQTLQEVTSRIAQVGPTGIQFATSEQKIILNLQEKAREATERAFLDSDALIRSTKLIQNQVEHEIGFYQIMKDADSEQTHFKKEDLEDWIGKDKDFLSHIKENPLATLVEFPHDCKTPHCYRHFALTKALASLKDKK